MRILIAPNAFKGSLTALQAARAMRRGVLAVLPKAEVFLLPISDGGDGLMDAVLMARGGKRVRIPVKGPFGEKRRAAFALMGPTAVVEMARASGLALAARRDPLNATSYGTGQLIKAAIARGAKTILVGMGGSATNDAGAGMAQALGVRLLDASGRELERGAQALLKLDRIEAGSLKALLRGVRIIGVSDVTNPLTGPKGSARVYGPQKGATPKMVKILEKALMRYARILKRDMGVSVAAVPGAGAAGGLGAGLLAFLGAELKPGAALVLKELGAKRNLAGADAAITGEGRLDRTSFYGKAPIEFARLARSLNVPTAFVCGSLDKAVSRRLKSYAVVDFPRAGASRKNSLSAAPRWAARGAALAVKKMGLATLLLLALSPGLRAASALGLSAKDSSTRNSLDELDDLYFHRNEGRNLEECQAKLESLLAERPKDAAILWRLGRGLVRLGERQDSKKGKVKYFMSAEERINQSLALNPADADAHFWLGLAMGRRGETKGILNSLFLVGPIKKSMAEAIRLNPAHDGAHHVLGEVLRQLPGFAGGSKKGAVKELEEAVRLRPNHTSHYPALAEAYLGVGDKEKAVAILEKIFEVKEPDDAAEYPDDLKDAREMLEKLKR